MAATAVNFKSSTERFTTPNGSRVSATPSPTAHRTLELMLQQKVHIAYLAGLFPTLSETFVYREVRELRRDGWDVSTVSLNDPPPPQGLEDLLDDRMVVYGSGRMHTLLGAGKEWIDHPLRVARTIWIALLDAVAPGEPIQPKDRLKLLGQAMVGIGLAGRLREAGVRHLHCHFAHAPASVGMYAAITMGVPFSFTGHANDLFQRRILLKRKLERASFTSCISHWHREFYRSIAPADDGDYPIIRCGVDTASWTPAAPVESPVLRVTTVCRLVEKKGVYTLLRAMRMFGDNTGRRWQLTIAGDGPQRDALATLANELSISPNVIFVGPVANEQVRDLLRSTDVFVLPCKTDSAGDRDGIPVVLMEAMARGVPVITGNLPAITELVEDGKTGLLVEGNDTSEVATAVGKIAMDLNLRVALSQQGRARVEEEFDLRCNINRIERRIEKTLAGNRLPIDPNAMQDSSAIPSRRYALITPCRDEAKFARRTLDSVTQQTVPPALWVIVDDGSKDSTPKILAEYAERFPYIKVITRADRGDRKLGGGVIDAFYTGYDTIDPKQFDYVCKLDLDLDLPLGYFEELVRRMEAEPRLGTASGKPYFLDQGRRIMEVCGDENSVGMVKFYRTACFQDIGGFVRELMWDGIDCHRCRMDGWLAVSWDDPAINFEHLRPMGTSHKSWWTGRVRHGVGQYFMGTSPAYLLASALFRLPKPPVALGSTAMVWGYAKSAWHRNPRYGDARFRHFLRSYQWDCLLRGKARATERLNRRQSVAWTQRAITHVE